MTRQIAIEEYPETGEMECPFADRVSYAQLLHDASEVEISQGKMILPRRKPNQDLVVVEAIADTRQSQ